MVSLVTAFEFSYHQILMPTKKSSPPDTEPRGRIFLIDAMSHIFRAYFAPMSGRVEPLRNSAGQVTQAIFIFTNML